MIVEAEPCKCCGAIPRVVRIDDLYYAQCTGNVKGKTCAKWSQYQFLGVTRNSAVESWNLYNTNNQLKGDLL